MTFVLPPQILFSCVCFPARGCRHLEGGVICAGVLMAISEAVVIEHGLEVSCLCVDRVGVVLDDGMLSTGDPAGLGRLRRDRGPGVRPRSVSYSGRRAAMGGG